METKLKTTLEELKSKVLENLEAIRLNEKVINLMLVTPESSEKIMKLKGKFEENKELLNENVSILDAQYKIVEIINKYKTPEEPPVKNVVANNFVDFFKNTIDGNIEFNENHPFFSNQKFIDDLIQYYSTNDRFEECSRLLFYKSAQNQ